MNSYQIYYGNQFHKYPKEILTESLCKYYVEYSWINIKYIPENILNKEMCNIAISKNYKAFEYIPDKFIDKDMILKIIQDSKGKYFDSLPEKFKDLEICTITVKLNNNNLEYVPLEIKDYNFCFNNLNIYSEAIKYVPEEFIDTNFLKKIYPNMKIKILNEIKIKEEEPMDLIIIKKKLNLLCNLQEYQTISAYYETVMDYNSYYTSFWRTISGDSRYTTLEYIKNIFELSYSYLYDKEILNLYTQALKKDIILKVTYNNDTEFCDQITKIFDIYRKKLKIYN